MRPRTRIAQAALLALCAGATAQAGQASLSFPVRLQVLSTCHVSAPPHPGLGPDAAGVARGDASALLIRCSRKTPFAIGLSASAPFGLAATGRGMDAISATLAADTVRTGRTAESPMTVHVDY